MVRHAERAKEHGASALTPGGRQRAQALVAAIGDKEITAIYSPDRGRNRETVQPLATHLGVPITLIPEARLSSTRQFADEFVREVLSKHAGGVVVWVGNKSPVGIWGGNLKEIYLRLGGTGDPPANYDDLYVITVPDQGAVSIKKTTYGKSAGRFDQ
jgi:broad specificity phosphatase PhoE